MSEAKERIRKTFKRYGAIYPVILDHQGKLIDGKHRLEVWGKWPQVRMKVKNPYDLWAIRTLIHGARRDISEQERTQQFRKMGGFLEKMGLKSKAEQAKKIAQDTGFSETYVRKLIEEPIRDVLTKPPLSEETAEELTGAKLQEPEMKKQAKEFGKKGAEFGKMGGRPVSWLTVCPSCGYKGKHKEFGRIKAE